MESASTFTLNKQVSFGSIEIIELNIGDDSSSCSSDSSSYSFAGGRNARVTNNQHLSCGMPARQNIEFFEACRLLSEMRKEIDVTQHHRRSKKIKKVKKKTYVPSDLSIARWSCMTSTRTDDNIIGSRIGLRNPARRIDQTAGEKSADEKMRRQKVTSSQRLPTQICVRKPLSFSS